MRVRIGEGLRYVVRHPYLRALFATSMIVNFFGRMLQVAVLVFMVRQAHLSAAWIGIAFSLGTIGFVVGAALAERVIERLGLGRAIVGGSLLTIPSFLLVAVTPRHLAVPFVAGWLLLYGFGAMMFNIGHATFRQATTPREILGRVNATLRFVSWGAVPIGTLLGGLLGSAFGLRAAMWVAAAGGLFGPLPLMLSGVRSLQTLPEPADQAGREAGAPLA